MKLTEALKREFNAAVRARTEELLREQVEAVAQAQVKRVLNGAGKAHAKTFKVKYPPSTVLKRGDKAALGHVRATTLTGLMSHAAWEALARDGHFASKATRKDLSAYLIATFKDKGADAGLVSAAISNALKIGLLVPA